MRRNEFSRSPEEASCGVRGELSKPRVAGSNPVAGTKSELSFPLTGLVTLMAANALPSV